MNTEKADPDLFQQSSLISTPHIMLNRNGGFSKNCFSSFNTSYHVGDDHISVSKNRKIIKKKLTINVLISAKQIHSDTIKTVTTPIKDDIEFPACDSIISNQPGTGILIQQADCQAILIHDPKNIVIAAIHCGWRGSVLNIINKTISRMKLEFGSNPATLQCAISPSLGPCCSEFINYKEELPKCLHSYQVRPQYFDFWKISREQLKESGVQDHLIDTVGQCTVCNTDFFSYRRAVKQNEPVTGRNGSAIALQSLI